MVFVNDDFICIASNELLDLWNVSFSYMLFECRKYLLQ